MCSSNQVTQKVRETGASCNIFYSNPSSVKSVEYLKLFFISLGIPVFVQILVLLSWSLI